MSSRRIQFHLVVCFILPCVSLAQQASTPSETEIAGRRVVLTLVKAEDLSRQHWPSGDVKLTAEATDIRADGNIYSLLEAAGIAPDTEAFTVVYDLNPMLRDLKRLPAGTHVVLPKITSRAHLLKMLHSGNLVQLTVDPTLRQYLNTSAESLQQVAQRFAQLPTDRFDSSDKGQAIQNKVATLAKWYAQIRRSFLRRTGPPLRQQTLLQMHNEADVLNLLLNQALQGSQRLSEGDQDQILAIYDDLELEMRKYWQVLANEAPKAEGLYKVVVNIKGQDTTLIDRLRVYYTVNGVFREPPVNPPVTSYPFKELGSGKSESLPVKNYKMWAAEDGNPAHPLTPPLLVKVSPVDGDTISVDLSLTKRTPQ
jgi:hypothetical protein